MQAETEILLGSGTFCLDRVSSPGWQLGFVCVLFPLPWGFSPGKMRLLLKPTDKQDNGEGGREGRRALPPPPPGAPGRPEKQRRGARRLPRGFRGGLIGALPAPFPSRSTSGVSPRLPPPRPSVPPLRSPPRPRSGRTPESLTTAPMGSSVKKKSLIIAQGLGRAENRLPARGSYPTVAAPPAVGLEGLGGGGGKEHPGKTTLRAVGAG